MITSLGGLSWESIVVGGDGLGSGADAREGGWKLGDVLTSCVSR